MFKLVVLSALVAIAMAKPSGLVAAPAVAAPLVAAPVVARAVVSPAAVSSTFRQDVVSSPVAVAYSAPLVAASPAVVAAPLSAPVAVAAPLSAPVAVAAHLSAYSVHPW